MKTTKRIASQADASESSVYQADGLLAHFKWPHPQGETGGEMVGAGKAIPQPGLRFVCENERISRASTINSVALTHNAFSKSLFLIVFEKVLPLAG
jgi:hypothetical protein